MRQIRPLEMAGNSLNPNTNQDGNIKNKKILCVDSSKRIRDALNLFFELEVHDFLSLETPAEALKVLQKDTYDIIIADYYLSGSNGLEFLSNVKLKFPKILGVLTIFTGDKKFVEEAKKAGISDVIQKPFSGETLLFQLSKIFEREAQSG
jgi:DNA-binding NtrC family response regulator